MYDSVDQDSDTPTDEVAEAQQPTVDIKKLRQAMKASYTALKPFRKTGMDFTREYVGHWYGENGAKQRLPNNLIATTVLIYMRSLYASNPKVTTSTPYREFKPVAAAFQVSMNNLLEDIDLDTEGRLMVLNAMFSIGVMKVGISHDGEADAGGTTFPIGKPYAKVVHLDDWVHDTCARTWDEISFCGNKYRVPLDWAQNNPMFDPAVAEKLKASHKDENSEMGGKDEEKVQSLTQDKRTDKDEYQQYVELWDIWLPYEKKIVTIPACGDGTAPLQEIEWDGPTHGPYHILNFIDTPNNIMPVAPVAHWLDFHRIINSLTRKLARQAEREKQVTVFARGDEDDAKRVTDAGDGTAVGLNNPQAAPHEVKYGGPDMGTQATNVNFQQTFNKVAGNPDSLGGLGTESPTLGQDQLIAQSTSKQLQEMQDRVVKALREIIRSLAWWHWTDNLKDIQANREIAPGMSIQSVIPPEMRSQTDFVLYNIDIEPFSMRGVSPQEKLQTFNQYMQATAQYMGIAQGAAQMGKMPNLDEWNALWANYSNTPEIKDLWIDQVQPMSVEGPQQPQQPPPRTPPATQRTYIRKNVPGQSRNGNANIIQNMAASGGAQGSEKAAVMGIQ